MTVPSRLIHRAIGEAEAAAEWLRRWVGRDRRAGGYHILPYRGHGTADTLHVSGRVLRGDPLPAASSRDTALRNLWSAVRRLASDEVPAARVRGTADGVSQTVLSDDEGFFKLSLEVPTPPGQGEAWREIELELLDPVVEGTDVRATANAIVPPLEARFGIISDIDDTVVETDVANLLRMLRLVLLTNAHTRLPFPGVAAFYRALHHGPAGPFTNPVFYVSSSPWNFYDLLIEVFQVHGIPAGPLFLKDYGLARDLLLSRGHEEHKIAAIEHILATHPLLPFVLVGDSGQKDPEIYSEVARRHPGRIEAVYIREVGSAERAKKVRAIAEHLAANGVEIVIVQDTIAAAEHAAAHGLIQDDSLEAIRREV